MAKQNDIITFNSTEIIKSLEFLTCALSVFHDEGIITKTQCDECVKSICKYISTSKDVKITKTKKLKPETKTKTKTKKDGKAN